ncbi:uncharacterized protein LOC116348227 [Contarinia nasturtii]|uniref:uncharacterized protein LOC116348227 n=1 Tax=Contarinia nasturtii TaxID=265458 RepID=UPI0012D45611|nr:uncharacterized protein LOC116348227 [Contarinia nasturtii]
MKPIQYQIIEQKRPSSIALHGEKIFDYYDWLKNETERKNRILKNEKCTLEKYLELNSQKNDWTEVRRRFHNPIDYELYSNVQYVNGQIFYSYRSFSKPIFKRVKSMKKDEHSYVVFDSNKLEHGSVVEHAFSPNGKYCAFTISEGDDSHRVIVIHVETGEIQNGNSLQLFSFKKIAWSGDSEGFFIYYDPQGRKKRNLHYHYLDENKRDKLIAKIRKSEAHTVSFEVSNDYKYLILCGSRMLSIANIESLADKINFKIIFDIFGGATYEYVGNDGDFFLFLTNERAPEHHIIEVDITSKRPGNHWDIVVSENLDGHGMLKSAFKYRCYLFLVYTENMQSSMYLYSLNNQTPRIEYKVDLTDEKIVSSTVDKYGIFFETRSFTTPRKVYRIEINQLVYQQPHETTYSLIEPTLWKESTIPNMDEMQIKIQYKSYRSFDGTNVPLTMIQKGGKFAPKKPCLIYACCDYTDSVLPRFDLYFLLFIELFNGVVVIIHTRGGCELGDEWLLKPTEAENSFNDLIEGVEYLKRESCITNIDPNKIAFYGVSHGGLAGAVVLNKRKRDLFKTVIFQNGNMDLIGDLANDKGNLWTKRYGSLDNKEDFDCIKRYAPLLHIQKPSNSEDCYPTTLLVASSHDEKVPFEQSLKYLAHRREISVNNKFQRNKPILLKVIQSGGHNYRTALKKEYIDTVFVKLQFLAEVMQLKCAQKYDTMRFAVTEQIIDQVPLIEYQMIEQRGPKVIALHREKIFDYYYYLKDKSERNDILEVEAETLTKYLELNSQKNDWTEVRRKFYNPMDYEMYSNVQYVNDYIFYSYMDFSKSIYKPIFKRAKSLKLDEESRVIFDSNKVLGAVIEHEYSPNGEFCAFTLGLENRKSYKLVLIEVKTGKTLGNGLQLFSCKKIAWSGDSEGFFVYYDPEGKKKRNLYYHYVNEFMQDKLIAKIRKTEAHAISFKVSHDYKYLILRDSRTLSIADIKSFAREIRFDLIFKMSHDIIYEYVGNEGEFFTFLTNFGATKNHVVEINIRSKIAGNHWDIVVAEDLNGHGVLKSAIKYRDRGYYRGIILVYIENVQNSLYLYSVAKSRIEFKIDTEDEKFVSMKLDSFGFFFETQTFKTPIKVYRVDFSQLVFRPPLSTSYYTTVKPMVLYETRVPNLDTVKLNVQHDSFQSFDKTNVPMTVIQRMETNDRKKPCLVTAYGAYGLPMLPMFKLFFLLFVELFNGIIIIIHSRGGGEIGDEWLLKSTEAEKSFNDLIAGVEYLKSSESYSKIIDSNMIAYYGASHGGLAGAVAVNKKRDLFKTVIFQNANMDLIDDLPSKGRIWAKQYGFLSNKVDFDCIKRYAPLLHIQKPSNSEYCYPTTLMVASVRDETVSIVNSLKYLAHRREKAAEDNEFQKNKPILLKVINSGGHHYETAKKLEIIDAVFVKLQFLSESMDMKFDKKYRKKHKQTQYEIYY